MKEQVKRVTKREWLVYMILASDNSLYTGITTDIQRRWRQHCGLSGGARFFRGRRPVRLVYLEQGHDRSSASKREAVIKKMTRSAKQALLKEQWNRCQSWAARLTPDK